MHEVLSRRNTNYSEYLYSTYTQLLEAAAVTPVVTLFVDELDRLHTQPTADKFYYGYMTLSEISGRDGYMQQRHNELSKRWDTPGLTLFSKTATVWTLATVAYGSALRDSGVTISEIKELSMYPNCHLAYLERRVQRLARVGFFDYAGEEPNRLYRLAKNPPKQRGKKIQTPRLTAAQPKATYGFAA